MEYILGNISNFENKINEIKIKGKTLFLINQDGNYKLYDSVCPHQGFDLKIDVPNETIYCPVHQWKFDVNTGCSKNVKSKKLSELIVYKNSLDELYVEIDETDISSQNSYDNIPNFEIHLHSHATLEFKTDRFSLLCDPWIEGEAFLGAWKHYPKPIVKTEEINPNAIWISHEHSDHFHEATLMKFDKKVAIYVPAFLNGRMEKRLKDMEFVNIHVVQFGEPIKICEEITITTFEPSSTWNDAQVLIDINGFKILNINDSGINHRVARQIGTVDLIASAFGPGASGYPLTWQHIGDEEKRDILMKAKKGILEMLSKVTEMYSAKYFLPFAGHFILGHPEHLKYMRLMEKNTVFDVVEHFEGKDCQVLGLLAGDYWVANENKLVAQKRGKDLYKKETILKYISENYDDDSFKAFYPSINEYAYCKEDIYSYFLNLNNVPEMSFSENLTMTVYPTKNNELVEDYSFSFEIKNGHLSILDTINITPNITMKIPVEILMYIVKNNESWDEATIGYWCEFSRDPDIYHAEFWRLLQTPYYLKNFNSTLKDQAIEGKISELSNVAEVLELLGETANKILGRYGLYCIACSKAIYETIRLACNAHGINDIDKNRMINELNIHLNSLQKVD